MKPQKSGYALEGYDFNLLREARERVAKVYGYHYGAPHSRGIIKRLETILDKIDYLISLEKEDIEK